MGNEYPEDDRYIVEACVKKDLKAWSCLISKYSKLVYISIDNRLKKYGTSLPTNEIEDIRQDIFTSIWHEEKLKNIVNTGDISCWIAIVSGNAAINYIRKSDTKERLQAISIHEKCQDEKEFADLIPSKDMKPEHDNVETELAQRIDRAIKALPSREKIIIKLHLIHDKKYHDIADMLNMPKGTVSNYIKRAKEKLKVSLKDLKTFLIIFATILALFTSYIVGA
ncbi:MAG: sigma-70 family RNA polymerase sigma factor [Candidatus Omnitrophota bacterium]|nr:sigma-70 family RNA polymerase sigma factor [Candidatus Omnitrophota bacterium]